MLIPFAHILIWGVIVLLGLPVKGALAEVYVPQCQGPATSLNIQVRISEGPIRFETEKDRQELTRMRKARPDFSTYSGHHQGDIHGSLVGGMMSGALRMDHKLSFVQHYNARDEIGCLTLSDISVDIHLSPKIYIAREYRDDACWFREIFTHELKHLDVDRAMAYEFQGLIRAILHEQMNKPSEHWSGQLSKAGIEQAKSDMKENVTNILNTIFQDMSYHRSIAQTKVDTPEEYEAISSACPPFQNQREPHIRNPHVRLLR